MRDSQISLVALSFVLAACGGQAPEQETEQAAEIAPAVAEVSEIATNPDKNAYFGDLHIHTGNSFDAFIFGTRTTPDDAYRFAKGETIVHNGGYDIQLEGPPLDFLAVTDHGEYMGVIPAMATPLTELNKTETAQSIFGADATDPRAAFLAVGVTIVNGEEIEEIYDRDFIDLVWSRTVEATERHNEPGKFTTFAGYEFTAMRQLNLGGTLAAANLHRNVIFRDDAPWILPILKISGTGWMGNARRAGTCWRSHTIPTLRTARCLRLKPIWEKRFPPIGQTCARAMSHWLR